MAGRHSGVKSQPRKLKGPGAFMPPAHAISTKNKHLLLACATNPRFHGGSFGVLGTPSTKPLNCKFVLLAPAMGSSIHGHTTSVTSLCSSSPNSVCRQKTSPGCRFLFLHRPLTFVLFTFDRPFLAAK